ncbi:tyrosine-type recombinase/integrase, partial [Nocardioides sp. GCM10030258]|uniref:tyrosine-type recombinase/integrase n=1 Tax=unclassified Nocardioides TaxID=2615069 RepID=UPI00360D3E2B
MAGNIAKRPDGSWRARYRDEQGRERSRHFDRKIDAQRWLDETAAAMLTGSYVDPDAGKVTFQQFYEQWSARQLWVASTRINADLATSSVPFGDLPLRSVRRSHVEEWVKDLSTRLAPTTIKTRFIIVRSVFRAAVTDRVITADPCAGVVLPRRRRADAAMRIPTVEEVGRLIEHADSPRVSTRKGFRAYVALCAFAGLRKAEAAAVQLGDLDLNRGQLSVTRQLQREGSTYVLRAPKYGSERTVYLPEELVSILSHHVVEHVTESSTGNWLFTVGDEPLYDNAIHWRWRATRSAAGLTRIRLHDLRHFYASGLIAAGCDVVTVQRALGHSSASTTLNTYSHLWPTAEDRTRAAASELMKQALARPSAGSAEGPEAGPLSDFADFLRTRDGPQRPDLRKQADSVVPGVRRPVRLT